MAAIDSNPEMSKRLVFRVLSHVDPNVVGPRLGLLAVRERKHVQTPSFMAITSRGTVPHITPDVIASHTLIGGVHMALEDCELEEPLWSRVHFPYSY
jgi:queuine tRNA-ribosyltransferase subunit QTRTD1